MLSLRIITNLAIILSGALLALAFAPINLYPFAILSPTLLLLSWLNHSPKECFWRGWLYGLGFFGGAISWVFVSIHVHGDTPWPLAFLLTTTFIAVVALYPALQGYLWARFQSPYPTLNMLLIFPISWVLIEWLRSWFVSGFPWVFVGHSQITSPLRGFAPILGVYGVSFIVLLLSACLALWVIQLKRRRLQPFFLLNVSLFSLSLLLGGYFLSKTSWTDLANTNISVSLIQGNIPQSLKWSSQALEDNLNTYKNLTELEWSSQLIVWPESAVPLSREMAQSFLAPLAATAKKNQTTLMLGIPFHTAEPDQYYNGILTIGAANGHYFKEQLVPFGEFVPFQQWLRGLIQFFDLPMSDFIPGPSQQAPLRINNDVIVAPFICYEIGFPTLLRDRSINTNLIVTVTNDAWFGNSFAPAQHVQIAQMASLQTGRYQLFAANDGITAIINPAGEIVARLPQFTQGVLKGEVQAANGITPWMQWGSTPLLISLLGIWVLSLQSRRRNLLLSLKKLTLSKGNTPNISDNQ